MYKKGASMTTNNTDASTQPKYFFVRVNAETYQEIVKLAKEEERSVNKMTNILLKRSLEK
jgi:hypothetical protein